MHVAIIGNGVAGATAALRLRRRHPDWTISLISGESDYHFSRPALMYIFMGHVRFEDTLPVDPKTWDAMRVDRVRGWVTHVDTQARRIHFDGQMPPLPYDALLVATGSEPNRFGWPGQDLDGVVSLYGLGDLDRIYRTVTRTRRAVIVGGGLIGIELAEMLHSVGVDVTFLVRERAFWDVVLPDEEARLVNRVIEQAGIDLRLETELAEIVDDGAGRVAGVVTNAGERIDCQLVGLTVGVHPNVHLAKASDIPTGRGVLVDRALRTQVDGVWAAGDCAEIVTGEERNLIQQVWYTAREQGRRAADSICGDDVAYEPGIWFNSAKFLDVEYQVYGRVPRTGAEAPGERSAYWEHPDGRHALRIVTDEKGVIGFDSMGIRLRHLECERAIRERQPLEAVLARLDEIVFDPEFFPRHEHAIRRAMVEVAA